jgi:hypothetical protein
MYAVGGKGLICKSFRQVSSSSAANCDLSPRRAASRGHAGRGIRRIGLERERSQAGTGLQPACTSFAQAYWIPPPWPWREWGAVSRAASEWFSHGQDQLAVGQTVQGEQRKEAEEGRTNGRQQGGRRAGGLHVAG